MVLVLLCTRTLLLFLPCSNLPWQKLINILYSVWFRCLAGKVNQVVISMHNLFCKTSMNWKSETAVCRCSVENLSWEFFGKFTGNTVAEYFFSKITGQKTSKCTLKRLRHGSFHMSFPKNLRIAIFIENLLDGCSGKCFITPIIHHVVF